MVGFTTKNVVRMPSADEEMLKAVVKEAVKEAIAEFIGLPHSRAFQNGYGRLFLSGGGYEENCEQAGKKGYLRGDAVGRTRTRG
jgi:hypothetical protein